MASFGRKVFRYRGCIITVKEIPLAVGSLFLHSGRVNVAIIEKIQKGPGGARQIIIGQLRYIHNSSGQYLVILTRGAFLLVTMALGDDLSLEIVEIALRVNLVRIIHQYFDEAKPLTT
jgi:hypothetical protein